MPWVVGIDEAGYGPNLGPLVQAAAMARLPAFDLAGWFSFSDTVRRAHETKDHRLIVDDSKKVYRGGVGYDDLENTLRGWAHGGCLADEIAMFGVQDSSNDFEQEGWADLSSLEVFPCPPCPISDAGLIPMRLNLVVARRLNGIIAETGSKASAIQRGYIGLVQSCFKNWEPDEPVVIFADKHGGRHYYAALLQETFPAGWVVAECETPAESRYRIENLPFQCTAIFRPKADGDSISVAMASMMAKYIRESCMKQFNAFWAKHVPGLKATAGYPGDAKRFFNEIEPAMQALGIPKDAVWRQK